jgi:hypothetical protein
MDPEKWKGARNVINPDHIKGHGLKGKEFEKEGNPFTQFDKGLEERKKLVFDQCPLEINLEKFVKNPLKNPKVPAATRALLELAGSELCTLEFGAKYNEKDHGPKPDMAAATSGPQDVEAEKASREVVEAEKAWREVVEKEAAEAAAEEASVTAEAIKAGWVYVGCFGSWKGTGNPTIGTCQTHRETCPNPGEWGKRPDVCGDEKDTNVVTKWRKCLCGFKPGSTPWKLGCTLGLGPRENVIKQPPTAQSGEDFKKAAMKFGVEQKPPLPIVGVAGFHPLTHGAGKIQAASASDYGNAAGQLPESGCRYPCLDPHDGIGLSRVTTARGWCGSPHYGAWNNPHGLTSGTMRTYAKGEWVPNQQGAFTLAEIQALHEEHCGGKNCCAARIDGKFDVQGDLTGDAKKFCRRALKIDRALKIENVAPHCWVKVCSKTVNLKSAEAANANVRTESGDKIFENWQVGVKLKKATLCEIVDSEGKTQCRAKKVCLPTSIHTDRKAKLEMTAKCEEECKVTEVEADGSIVTAESVALIMKEVEQTCAIEHGIITMHDVAT